MSTQDATRRRVETTLTAPLAASGYDIEGLEITPAGRRRVLRVAVDKDGGVTLDDVAEVTREVSRLLDDEGAMGEQPYTLEVTSRGVDRPLTLPRHYRRNLDRLVAVEMADGRSLTGRIVGVQDEVVHLDVDGAPRDVPLGDVRRALVQVEFNRRSAAATSGPSGEDGEDDEIETDEVDDENDENDEGEDD